MAKSVNISVKVDPVFKELLQNKAKKHGITFTDYLRNLLMKGMMEDDAKNIDIGVTEALKKIERLNEKADDLDKKIDASRERVERRTIEEIIKEYDKDNL